MYEIDKVSYLRIGQQGENQAVTIELDMTSWADEHPDASFAILFKPYNEDQPSPVLTTYEEPVLTWVVGSSVTQNVGVGYTEIRAFSASGLIKKSKVIPTSVESSVSGGSSVTPPAYADWVNNVLGYKEAAETAQEAAEAAQEAAETAAESVVNSSVRYDTAQTLNDTQKETARENIGAFAALDGSGLKSDVQDNAEILLHKDYGDGLIPTSPAYVQYINPNTYDFKARYGINNVFSCEIVSDSTGARTVGFNQANSSGFETVDLTGKIVRVSHDTSKYAHNNVQYVIWGVSDDGTAHQGWSLDLNAQETGQFVFDANTFVETTGYKNLFIVGFYFNGSSNRTKGEIYQFKVEIADADEVQNGWILTERIENQMDDIENQMDDIKSSLPKVVYDFSSIHMKGINHRGFNSIAPENTLPAFRLSKQKGFDFVETDVEKTSDGVYVLLHDTTINRTARNADGSQLSETINIADITYNQALAYDFGIWKNNMYAGTKIPTFEEFIALCGKIGLYCYIELKQGVGLNESDIQNLIAIARKYHMEKRVSWISFSWQLQKWVHDNDGEARVGWLGTNMPLTVPEAIIEGLTNGRNEAFVDANVSGLTAEFISKCQEYSIPVEVYCPNTEEAMLELDDYITGASSDLLNFTEVVKAGNIGEVNTGV